MTMETLGIDYKKVSSQKNQWKKMIGAGTLGGTNLYRQSGMVWRQVILGRKFINNFIINGYDFS